MSAFRRLIVVCVAAACTSNPGTRAGVAGAGIDSRPALVRIADSTSMLVTFAAMVADTANSRARVALVESAPDRAREQVQMARTAAQTATSYVAAAIGQGDQIDQLLPDASLGATGSSASYSRYWKMGREKLDLARARSASAVQAADLALACAATECGVIRAREMQGYIEQAAGAAREAESLVRIAMVYVGIAMNYVR